MPKLETDGYKGWWEMKQFLGRDRQGKNLTKEVFRNMVTGEVYDPGEKGWNGSPPYPTGSTANIRHYSDAYRRNYDLIVWDKDKKELAAGNSPLEYDTGFARCRNCGHEFAAVYEVEHLWTRDTHPCPKCGRDSAEPKEA